MKVPSKIVVRLIAVGLAIALAVVALGEALAKKRGDPPQTEANITRLTAGILARSQFAHHPLDTELAGKFFDGYLDALDGRRSIFLQSDVEEFATYRASLALLTRQGDTSAAHAIWDRYLRRLRERAAYLEQLLRTDPFDFTGHETYSLDPDSQPAGPAQRPRDAAAAREGWRQQLRAEYLDEKLHDVSREQIVRTLNKRHAQQLKMMEGLSSSDVLELYLNALAHVYDPHSDYLGREQMESLSINMNLSLFGIGAALESKDGYCTIREVLPGGPAARGGILQPGDRIIAVAQAGQDPVDIMDMPLSRIVELIRGPKGTSVTLTIIPAGSGDNSAHKPVSLVRDEIKLEDQQAKARILDLPSSPGPLLRLGVLDLPSFYGEMGDHPGGGRSASADVRQLLTKLKAESVQGLILDLRRNGGGSLEEAIRLTGLFISQGPVVQTRGPDGAVEVEKDSDPAEVYSGPLVVLTSRFSASASEILAGALEDYGRAVIVGDSSTFGKGTVQSILPLAPIMDQNGLAHSYDPGALKVTIRKFYRPSGSSTQLRGVVSDIVLPSTTDFSDVSESSLKNPLSWDTVPAAAYARENRVSAFLDALREKSARRIASDPDFVSQAEEIARLRKSIATKTISLNEAERRGELAEAKARQAEHDRQRRTRAAHAPRTYEISVAAAASPGLPKPLAVDAVDAGVGAAGKGESAARPAGEPGRSSSPHATTAEDLVLDETVHILEDYVLAEHLLAGHAPVGPGATPSSRVPSPLHAP